MDPKTTNINVSYMTKEFIDGLVTPTTASDFHCFGTVLTAFEKCGCEACLAKAKQMRGRFAKQADTAVTFVKDYLLVFKALMGEWGEKEIKDALEKK